MARGRKQKMLTLDCWKLGTVLLVISGHGVAAQETELQGIVVESPSPLQTQAFDPGTGGPASVIAADTFFPVTIITGTEIEGQHDRTLGDVMFTEPGITSSTFAPGSSRPIIRGLDNFRVRLQENGVGSHDVSALSEDHAVTIDPLIVDQIEVIRGPATLRYGSQAIGGVVNANNNRIPDAIPGEGFYNVVAKGGYTTVDEGGEGALIVEGGADGFAFHADLYKRQTENYSIPGTPAIQKNSETDTEGGALGGSLVGDNGFIGVSFSRHQSDYQIPGGEAEEREVRIDLDQKQFRSEGELRMGSGLIDTISYWFGFTDYEHDEIANHDGEVEVASTFIQDEYEARTEVTTVPVATPLGELTAAFGAQYGTRKLTAQGEGGELLEPTETVNFAGYVFKELEPVDGLAFQFAGRIEDVYVSGTAGDFPATFLPPPDEPGDLVRNLRFNPVSGSVGVKVGLPQEITATFNGQYVERAPDGLELFARGPHEATATFEIGNPDIGIEVARTLEGGLKRGTGAARFEANAYYTEFDGFIFKRLTGNECGEEFDDCGVEDELTQIVYTQQDATFYGVELSGELDIFALGNGVVGVDGQYDYVRGYFPDGTNVPRITPERVGAGLFFRSDNLLARVGAVHALRQDTIAVNEMPTSSFTLLNSSLSYTTTSSDPNGRIAELTIGVSGENLLDDDVRNHVSFKKEDVLLPGRNFKLRGKVKLN